MLCMFRAPDIGAVKLLSVTSQAPVYNLSWLHDAESVDDGYYVAAGIDVSLAKTVTSFAAAVLRRFFARSNCFVMRVLVEVVPNLVVFVAVSTAHLAGESPLHSGCIHRCLSVGLGGGGSGSLPG